MHCRAGSCRRQVLSVAADERACVAHRDVRGVGVGAIGHHLQRHRPAGLQALAQKIWIKNDEFFKGQEERMGLKPMAEFRREAVDRLLASNSGLTPEMQAQLRTALNLPAPTNAPPAQVPPPAPPLLQ